MLVLHGILGAGNNLRTFAKSVALARPDWRLELVDLRMHGMSQGAPPPHTIASAAADLTRLVDQLGDANVRGVLGHSFGGKVALEFSRARPAIEIVYTLDSNPGARVGADVGASRIVDVLTAVPQPLPSRERFLELMEAAGISKSTAAWLATNLRSSPDGYRIRLDLKAIRDLLDDYFALDSWDVLESEEPASQKHVVVIGGRSTSFSAEDRARAQALAARSARVSVHVLEKADHWVHVDDPEGLLDVVAASLP